MKTKYSLLIGFIIIILACAEVNTKKWRKGFKQLDETDGDGGTPPDPRMGPTSKCICSAKTGRLGPTTKTTKSEMVWKLSHVVGKMKWIEERKTTYTSGCQGDLNPCHMSRSRVRRSRRRYSSRRTSSRRRVTPAPAEPTTTRAPTTPPPPALTGLDAERACIEDANRYRRRHLNTPDFNPEPDVEMMNAAQYVAEYSAMWQKMSHTSGALLGRYNQGENLARTPTLNEERWDKVKFCVKANRMWYAEIKNYNFTTGDGGITGYKGAMVFGHFTQMVWDASTAVAFGYARSKVDPTKQYVAARYKTHQGSLRSGDRTPFLKHVHPPKDWIKGKQYLGPPRGWVEGQTYPGVGPVGDDTGVAVIEFNDDKDDNKDELGQYFHEDNNDEDIEDLEEAL